MKRVVRHEGVFGVRGRLRLAAALPVVPRRVFLFGAGWRDRDGRVGLGWVLICSLVRRKNEIGGGGEAIGLWMGIYWLFLLGRVGMIGGYWERWSEKGWFVRHSLW